METGQCPFFGIKSGSIGLHRYRDIKLKHCTFFELEDPKLRSQSGLVLGCCTYVRCHGLFHSKTNFPRSVCVAQTLTPVIGSTYGWQHWLGWRVEGSRYRGQNTYNKLLFRTPFLSFFFFLSSLHRVEPKVLFFALSELLEQLEQPSYSVRNPKRSRRDGIKAPDREQIKMIFRRKAYKFRTDGKGPEISYNGNIPENAYICHTGECLTCAITTWLALSTISIVYSLTWCPTLEYCVNSRVPFSWMVR